MDINSIERQSTPGLISGTMLILQQWLAEGCSLSSCRNDWRMVYRRFCHSYRHCHHDVINWSDAG